MDLLFIACAPPYPIQSEHQKLLAYLMREFAQRRFVMDLLAFYEQPEDLIDVPRYEQDLRYLHLVKAPVRDLQTRLRQGAIVPPDQNRAWSSEMWQVIRTRLLENRYDFVQLIGSLEVYEYYPLVKNTPHLIAPLYSQSRQLQQELSRTRGYFQRRSLTQQLSLIQQYEAQIYQNFDTVVMANEAEEKSLLKLHNYDNLISLSPGIETDYFVPTGQEPDQPALLFIGDFHNDIDVKTAHKLCTEIFPAVRRTVPEIHLYIVGEAPPSELQKFSSPYIDVVGKVLDVRPFFELATVYVSPVSTYTGIREDILQALAMATPIVATAESCIGLALEPDRHLLMTETAHEMTVGIIRLLQSPELRQRFRSQGRQHVVEFYDWREIAAQYENLYQRHTV